MQLQALANGTSSVSRLAIANQPELARDIQAALTRLGLLDGPPDGKFGPVSNWALDAFLAARAPAATSIDAAVARELLNGTPWPLVPGADYAGRVLRRMLDLGHFISRHPDCVNIVYIEGVAADGTPTGNKPNRFDDTRMILSIRPDGVPVAETWEATTEPGQTFTINPLDPNGAARIAFNQYKSWCVGLHPRSGAEQHEALVQVGDVNVFRDLNKDFRREGDKEFRGMFGINQHWGFDLPQNNVGNASAGCLVGRTKAGHRKFMQRVKEDARFRVNAGYRFQTAILDGAQLPA